MSFVADSGALEGSFVTPANTSLNTAFTAANATSFLHSVNMACIAAADATVVINDGSTDYELLAARPMTTGEHLLVEWRDGIPLRNTYSVKVMTSVADKITFTVVTSARSRG
ncbi:MAG: hypothetical protein GY943_30595 [Chloroflexi bacterium]|nr:hypothetical protein [Chloroflexota bacterium]